jgi:hypothetical protein
VSVRLNNDIILRKRFWLSGQLESATFATPSYASSPTYEFIFVNGLFLVIPGPLIPVVNSSQKRECATAARSVPPVTLAPPPLLKFLVNHSLVGRVQPLSHVLCKIRVETVLPLAMGQVRRVKNSKFGTCSRLLFPSRLELSTV